jgi:flagellar biosynthetic protein FliR
MGILDALQRILATNGVQVDVILFIQAFGLAMARITTILVLAPFMGQSVSGRIKIGLAVVVTAVLYDKIGGTPAQRNIDALMFFGLLLKEAMIGAAIGFLTQLVFYAVQMAGVVIDTQRGMNQMTFFAPQLPGNVSALGMFQFQAALALFFSLDGHLFFLDGVARSFAPLPVFEYPTFHAGLEGVINQMIRFSADSLVVAMQLAAPVLVALFLVDVAFGAIGKVASQINVHQESQPVKSLVGLAVFFFAVAFLMEQFKGHVITMLRQMRDLASAIS